MVNSATVLYRILDANLDRAREGLRVIEEWCRFGLQDETLTQTCKHLRQTLGQFHTRELRLARNTPEDPGTGLTHVQEAQRTDLGVVVTVNLARVQEALRVLEEYGKLYSPNLAATAKHIRYQVYILESSLIPHPSPSRQERLLAAPLYLVTSPEVDLLSIVEAALQGGLKLVQYRDKQADDMTRFELAQQLQALCQRYDALFLVNDRVDLALAIGADGVHLGQQDLPIAVARQILGPDSIIGRSTTNPSEMAKAIQEGADYIGVGPVYETPTKAGKAAAGLSYVEYAASHSPIPWYAIGSVDQHNLSSVITAGAQRVAVVRAIMQAASPTEVTRTMLEQLSTHSAVATATTRS